MTRLFVANFPPQTTKEDLQARFGLYGELKDCFLIETREGVSRGFGFIEFCKTENAEEAMRELDGANFLGRRIVVKPANERVKHA